LSEDRNALSVEPVRESALPKYEPPRIQVMTEREILNTFQITQSMASWWTTSCC
jgi:hypothetical protein